MKHLSLDFDSSYWKGIRKWAALYSDGCSGVADFYQDACLEHDYHYRYARTVDGRLITRAQADARFRRVVQAKSILGCFSPMAIWRWIGLRLAAEAAWENHRQREALDSRYVRTGRIRVPKKK